MMNLRIRKFEDFRFVRKVRGLNLALQIALGFTLFVGLNFLASRHYLKHDFSENRMNSLSPESVAYIENLKAPVEIYMTIREPDSQGADQALVAESKAMVAEIERLLSQYEYESMSGGERKIRFQKVDPLADRRKGEELVRRFGNDVEGVVIVASGDKHKKILLTDIYDIEDNRRVNFKGEQAVSSALLSVSNPKQNKIYFLTSHGELSYKSADAKRGLSELGNALSLRGYKLGELDLSSQGSVPADADMLIIAAPQTAMLAREVDAIRKYLLNSNGRVVMFLGLGPIYGLEDVLFEWGLRADDMQVADTGEYESTTGDLITRSYPQKPHPIVKYLVGLELPVQFGTVRPVREDLGAPIDGNLKLWPLIGSSQTSWADRAYKRDKVLSFHGDVDLPGPLPLAMLATRSGGGDLGVDIRGGRLAVFGDEDFITNGRFNGLGNSKLALNTINWMFDETSSLNIPPRKVDRYTLTISRGDIWSLTLRFLGLPFAVLLAGLATYILRRQ